MASESFSNYLMQWPGCFGFLGMKNDAKGVGAAHHNQNFDIDEAVLSKGRAAAATYAIEFLKNGPDVKGLNRLPDYRTLLENMKDYNTIKELYGE